jgi:integrase
MLSVMAGQIIPRGKNTWLVRVYIGRDAVGKRSYLNKTIHGTKKDAQQWLTTTLRDRDMGLSVQPRQGTLNDYLDRWLESVAKPKVRRKTFAGYKDTLALYVRPALGARPLAKLGPMEIQAQYEQMSESGLSPRTVQYTHMILNQALGQAVKWKMIFHNPCDTVSLPRQQRKEMAVLTPDQARRFIAASRQDRYSALFQLAVTTGMRPSEYCALKWPDLDLDKHTVTVNRSMDSRPGGGWEFAENKTGRSRRQIKLQGAVAEALREHRRLQEQEKAAAAGRWLDLDLVFTNEVGGPVDRHNLAQRNFRRILKTAGLPRVRLYDLRHTAATLALSAGVPIKVVSEMLGHTSTAFTMDVYCHVLPHMQEEAAQKVERLLMGDEPGRAPRPEKRHTIGTQRVQ